jgi:hypothetical protein
MAITFKSLGHALATFYKAAVSDLSKVEATKTKVEAITAGVVGAVAPTYGPLALNVENAAYALLGEVSAALTSGGAAAEAGLANAGLDANVVATVKAIGSSATQVATLITAATK